MTTRTSSAAARARARRSRTNYAASRARARRVLVTDVLAAAVLAAVALSVAAGLGVVAFFGIPILLVGLVWIGLERAIARLRRRRHDVP